MAFEKAKLYLGGAAVLLIVLCTIFYPDMLWQFTETTPATDAEHIPPAFSGNRAAYGFALFSLFTISTLSLRKIASIALQLRHEPWREEPDIGLYRLGIAFLLAAIFVGTAPDVALMILWGEASARTLTIAMTIDRLGDGIALVPYLLSVTIVVRAEQLTRNPKVAPELDDNAWLPHVKRPVFFEILPRREDLRDHLTIILGVAAIALGLALWK